MSGQRRVIGVVAAVVLANAGCVSCNDACYRKATENAAACELPLPCRTQLYVYMIQGVTPSTDDGLEALRLKLSENGFPKIGVSELACAPLVASEIKKTAKCEPEARFVLLGYDLGGAAAVALARDLGTKGVPVEAVVLLDPVACGESGGVPTLIVTNGTTGSTANATSGRAPEGSKNNLVWRVVVSDAGHFTLPTNPATVAVITDLLKEIAARNYQDPGESITSWSYRYAPAMHAASGGVHGPQWNFLADTNETPPAITTPTVSLPSKPSAPVPVSTSAGPVLLPK